MDFWLSEIYFCLPAQTIMMVSCECLGACYATKKKKYNINTFWAPSIKCTVCVFIISSNIFFYFSHVWKKILCFYSSLFSSWHLCICYPQTSPKTLQLYTGLAQAITYRLGRSPCIIEPGKQYWQYKAVLLQLGTHRSLRSQLHLPGTDVCKPRYVPWQSVSKASLNCHASYQAKPYFQMVLCENFITQEESKFC